jgi:SAM-dependent methyltransferase
LNNEGDSLVDEFDTIAAWTAEVLRDLSPSHTIPGACRGSGNPAALAWLAEALEVTSATTFLDTGGGLGGPAGWLAERYQARPIVCDPMGRAVYWGNRLFGLPAVTAWADSLPFAPHSFDASWALGVLSTTDQKDRFLREVRRVLKPAGRFGLLEYVTQTAAGVPDAPSGNQFLSPDSLRLLLANHGFVVIDTISGERLPRVPLAWQARVDHVKAAVAAVHPGSAALARAEQQERRFVDLLTEGTLEAYLVHAVNAS